MKNNPAKNPSSIRFANAQPIGDGEKRDVAPAVMMQMSGKKKGRFSLPTAAFLVTAFGLAALIIFVLTTYPPPPTPSIVFNTEALASRTASATPQALASGTEGEVLELQGNLTYQGKNQENVQLQVGDIIPANPPVRLFTDVGFARLWLSSGAEVVLDRATTVYLADMTSAPETDDFSAITLERGRILVISGSVRVINRSTGSQGLVTGAMMGVVQEQTLGLLVEPISIVGLFTVYCFGPNPCVLQGKGGAQTLQAGEKRGYEDNILGSVQRIENYEDWKKLGDIPIPTSTPTPSITPIIEVTLTPTPTPTSTPTVQSTQSAPTARDPTAERTGRPDIPPTPEPTIDPGGG